MILLWSRDEEHTYMYTICVEGQQLIISPKAFVFRGCPGSVLQCHSGRRYQASLRVTCTSEAYVACASEVHVACNLEECLILPATVAL